MWKATELSCEMVWMSLKMLLVGWFRLRPFQLVPTSAFPPTFDNTPIVPKNLDVRILLMSLYEGGGEKEKSDCFGPPDVPAFVFPPWEEAPGSPLLADGDSNAHFRASI